MSPADRYWAWAAFGDAQYATQLIKHSGEDIQPFGNPFSILNPGKESISDTLLADTKMVLPNDMLTKVDLMSMANSLEVRVPFLDHRVVEFAFGLPDDMKIDGSDRKRIVKEAFRSYLPDELLNRGKHGFEVPLLKWLRNELKSLLDNDLLNSSFIEQQGIFEIAAIRKLQKQLASRNPGDAHAKIWALLVFQWWWKKYFTN